jgi:hypothetical protein
VDAIIFLAPISAFDQVLTEDRSINRLEDSVLLWKALCSSKLLGNVDLILFLNKCDILERKLRGGIRSVYFAMLPLLVVARRLERIGLSSRALSFFSFWILEFHYLVWWFGVISPSHVGKFTSWLCDHDQ